MLFYPPIDELVNKAGNKYVLTVLMSARARELQKKIPAMLEGNSNIALSVAADEILRGVIVASNN